jgi:hypothetical protein
VGFDRMRFRSAGEVLTISIETMGSWLSRFACQPKTLSTIAKKSAQRANTETA